MNVVNNAIANKYVFNILFLTIFNKQQKQIDYWNIEHRLFNSFAKKYSLKVYSYYCCCSF